MQPQKKYAMGHTTLAKDKITKVFVSRQQYCLLSISDILHNCIACPRQHLGYIPNLITFTS